MRRAKAFTLVELLVVVAIIALLLAILLPALGKARAIARNVKCLSNIRGINMAVMYYGGDNSDYAVPETITSWNTDGGPAPSDYPGWLDVAPHHAILLGQYTDIEATDNRPQGEVPDNSVWKCPEDKRSNISYSMAHRITAGGAGQFFAAITSNPDRWLQMRKLANAGSPAALMTVIDKDRGATFGFNGSWPLDNVPFYGNPANSGTPGGWSKNQPLVNWNHRMRHPPGTGDVPALGTNMGFVDGHAQMLINDPADLEDEYWLKDQYGVEFVIRPEDY